jgi:hypothetical protein
VKTARRQVTRKNAHSIDVRSGATKNFGFVSSVWCVTQKRPLSTTSFFTSQLFAVFPFFILRTLRPTLRPIQWVAGTIYWGLKSSGLEPSLPQSTAEVKSGDKPPLLHMPAGHVQGHFNYTFARRTSGPCLGTLRTVKFSDRFPVINVAFLLPPRLSLHPLFIRTFRMFNF